MLAEVKSRTEYSFAGKARPGTSCPVRIVSLCLLTCLGLWFGCGADSADNLLGPVTAQASEPGDGSSGEGGAAGAVGTDGDAILQAQVDRVPNRTDKKLPVYIDLRDPQIDPSNLGEVLLGRTVDLRWRIEGGTIEGKRSAVLALGTDWAFDLTGSQQWKFRDFTLSSQNPAAQGLIRCARPPGGFSGGVHTFRDFGVSAVPDASRPNAAVMNLDGSEACLFEQCVIYSGSAAPGVLLTTESGGLITATFRNCHFALGAEGQTCVTIRFGPNACEQIVFENCSFTATAGQPTAGLLIESPTNSTLMQLTIRDCSFETDAAEHAVWSRCPTALLTIERCRMLSQGSVIKLEGSEQSACTIERNHLKSWRCEPLIHVSQTNYASRIDGLYYMHDAGAVWVRFDREPLRTTLVGFPERFEIAGKTVGQFIADRQAEQPGWQPSFGFTERP